jgi:hypothetical protein
VEGGGQGSPADRGGAAGVHGGGGGEDQPRRGRAAVRRARGAGAEAGGARARSEARGGARARARRLHQPPRPASEHSILDTPSPSLGFNGRNLSGEILFTLFFLFLKCYSQIFFVSEMLGIEISFEGVLELFNWKI